MIMYLTDRKFYMIDYKFNEINLIQELTEYVNKTYGEHYAGEHKIQTVELMLDRGRAEGFFLGNVDKYSNRYGYKGDSTEWRKDLLKILHYTLIMLYAHDEKYGTKEEFDGRARDGQGRYATSDGFDESLDILSTFTSVTVNPNLKDSV